MRRTTGIMAGVPLFLAVACGSGETGGGGAGADAGIPDDGFETITAIEWEAEPGEQKYYCLRKTVEEEMYIGAFEALAPAGTHHTVLSVGPTTGPDGVRECGSYDHNFNSLIYESSSDDGRFVLPEGLAAHITPGQQLNLNLHILNTGDSTLTGTSGTRIKLLDPSEVEEVSTAVYMGKLALDIPPGESTHVGTCQLSHDITIFGVLPHMHSFATHMKVVAKSSIEGDVVVHDEPFLFDSTKEYHPFEPVQLKAGDTVEVHCSYHNTTNGPLYWGQDSYSAEMCFAAMYLFPAAGQTSACAQ